MHDVIIIGAGPAGLSAALVLARCRRTVAIFSSSEPGSAPSKALHGFLTRDGVCPQELRMLGRAELDRYPCVTFHEEVVNDIRRTGGMFEVVGESGRRERSRLLLLATGRAEGMPQVPGFAEFYGRGVFHCPYCDGWEYRGQPMAVYGNGPRMLRLARDLFTWTDDVTICSEGAPAWPGGEEAAKALGIRLITRKVRRLDGGDAGLTQVNFDTGEPLTCGALFFDGDFGKQFSLAEKLGCRFDENRAVVCNHHAAINVPGVFLAGNVSGGVRFAVTAASEGAQAAVFMNETLLDRAFPGTCKDA